MNKTNNSFLKIRIEYTYNILIIVYGFILLSNYLIFIIYSLFSDSYGHFDFRRNFNRHSIINNNQINIEQRMSNLSSDRDSIRHSHSNRNSESNNNEIRNDVHVINVRIHEEDEDKKESDLYPKNLNKSFNPESNEFFKEFEPINVESVTLKKGNLCVYCGTNPSKIIFSPCGHRCLCQNCYNTSKRRIKNCPICRKEINNFIEHIFDV